MILFTIGYQGRNIEEYLKRLSDNGVKILFDVRKNAMSRKPGFSKTKLREYCQESQIKYRYFPGLGVNSKDRKNLKSSSNYEALFARYVDEVLEPSPIHNDLQQIRQLLGEYRVGALTCFEEDHTNCHRHCIAHKLKEMEPDKLEVNNI